MGIFRQFPYSNFHDMNMDEIIEIVKNMLEEWASYYNTWDNWKEQVTAEWAQLKDYIDHYFDTLNLQNEVNIKINQMVSSGAFNDIVSPYIPDKVATWLADHITQPTSPVVDTSLTISGAAADAKVTGDALRAIRPHYIDYTDQFNTDPASTNGITYTHISGGEYLIEGTATGLSFKNLIVDMPVSPAEIFNFYLTGKAPIRVYIDKTGGGSYVHNFNEAGSYSLIMPSDAVDITVRWNIAAGTAIPTGSHSTLRMNKRNNLTYADLFDINSLEDRGSEIIAILTKYGHCNIQKGRFYVRDMQMPDDCKITGCGADSVIILPDDTKNFWTAGDQEFTRYKEFDINMPAGSYIFKADVATTDTDANRNAIVFYYTQPYDATNGHYVYINRGQGEETVINAEQPIIHIDLLASDTYSKATGDNCTFNNINITKERTTCISIGDECIIENLKFMGSLTDIDVANDGRRDGVLYSGLGANTQKHKGVISNCFFENFTGAGLTLIRTGYSSSGGLNIDNCYFNKNHIGINIPFFSEFHRFNNCSATLNKYGCVNNGGNNQFTGCNFSSNAVGFIMDNSAEIHNNNAHGGVSGCIFQHNTGRAIEIVKNYWGFVFTGCNIDKGGVRINNSSRIIFNACNFMDEFKVDINGMYEPNNGIILFTNSLFRDEFTGAMVHIANNDLVKFINCFKQNGDIVNP